MILGKFMHEEIILGKHFLEVPRTIPLVLKAKKTVNSFDPRLFI